MKPSHNPKLLCIFIIMSLSKSASSSLSRSSSSSRLYYSYEITHLTDKEKIPITKFPLVNPYTIFFKPSSSISKTFKQLIGPKNPKLAVKEYVQASKFNRCQIQVGIHEQLVTLHIPE